MAEPVEPTIILHECAWVAGGSDVGQTRIDNEDSLLCDFARGVFVVADGMGGHAAGEQASATVVRTLDSELAARPLRDAMNDSDETVRALVETALGTANARILQLGIDYPEWSGLGSTAVIAIVNGDQLYVVNVGDSRAYLLHGEHAEVLTRDHSVAAMLLESENLSADELRDHPLRNSLTMILGSHGQLDPAFTTRTLRQGDRVLLCTDGLWDMLDDLEIAQIVHFSATPREAVYSLIAAAADAGGTDNITAVVIFHDKRLK